MAMGEAELSLVAKQSFVRKRKAQGLKPKIIIEAKGGSIVVRLSPDFSRCSLDVSFSQTPRYQVCGRGETKRMLADTLSIPSG